MLAEIEEEEERERSKEVGVELKFY